MPSGTFEILTKKNRPKTKAEIKAYNAAEAAEAKEMNAKLRGQRQGITIVDKPKISKASQFMNSVIRGGGKMSQVQEEDIDEELKKAAPESNAGAGTETIGAFKRPKTMNEAIREIQRLRRIHGH